MHKLSQGSAVFVFVKEETEADEKEEKDNDKYQYDHPVRNTRNKSFSLKTKGWRSSGNLAEEISYILRGVE